MTARNRSPLFITANILALLAAAGLSVESYLLLRDTSLCGSKGCEVVGRYIRYGEPFLVAGGAVFFWLLTAVLFFFQRYQRVFSRLLFTMFAAALAFDGTLIGFQIFTIQEVCLLCLGVALFLVAIALLCSLGRRSISLVLAVLFCWLGGFTAGGIVKMPMVMNAGQEMFVYQLVPGEKTGEKEWKERNSLIISMDCPHCLRVITCLAEKNPRDSIWRIAVVDEEEKLQQKAAGFTEKAEAAANPFALLKEMKKSSPEEVYPVPDSIGRAAERARAFLANLGIYTVPVLVVEDSPDSKRIISGSRNILQHLER